MIFHSPSRDIAFRELSFHPNFLTLSVNIRKPHDKPDRQCYNKHIGQADKFPNLCPSGKDENNMPGFTTPTARNSPRSHGPHTIFCTILSASIRAPFYIYFHSIKPIL